MIRFIDLTGQIFLDDDRYFAWFDTVTDTFVNVNGSQFWDNWAEFEHDFREDEKQVLIPNIGYSWSIERFSNLYPNDWPKNNL